MPNEPIDYRRWLPMLRPRHQGMSVMPKSPALLASILLLLLPTRILAQPQPLGPLWHDSHGSVVLTQCPEGGDHDAGCRAVELRSAGTVTKLGAGYIRVKLLWARKGHERGPNALLLGDYGGSGGNADLFAVTTAPTPRFRKLGANAMTPSRHARSTARCGSRCRSTSNSSTAPRTPAGSSFRCRRCGREAISRSISAP